MEPTLRSLIGDAERGAGLMTMLRISDADCRMVRAVIAEQGQSDVRVSVPGEAPTLVGQATPVPPAPQYAPGFLSGSISASAAPTDPQPILLGSITRLPTDPNPCLTGSICADALFPPIPLEVG